MDAFILYGTTACHLCELAHDLLEAVRGGIAESCAIEEVDISNSDELFERYGVRIPVLKHPDGRELNWPFSAEEAAAFLLSPQGAGQA